MTGKMLKRSASAGVTGEGNGGQRAVDRVSFLPLTIEEESCNARFQDARHSSREGGGGRCEVENKTVPSPFWVALVHGFWSSVYKRGPATT